SIAGAQSQVEAQNYEIRKNVLKYDDVLNRQRQVIYAERRQVLEGADMEEQIRHFINDVVAAYVNSATAEGYSDTWDLDQLWTALGTLFPVSITVEDVATRAGGRSAVSRDVLLEELTSDAHHAYDQRQELLGEENMREIERRVVMSVLDRKWREHLYEMDYLQEGIGLRAMAQRDPLVEYQREGFQLFEAMMDGIKEESVGFLFNAPVQIEQTPAPAPAPTPIRVSDMVRNLAASGANPQDASDEDDDLDADDDEGMPSAPADPLAGTAFSRSTPGVSVKGLEATPQATRLHYSAPGETGSVEHREVDAAGGAVPDSGGYRRPTPRRSSKKARRRGK
ncbi:MAG TPA: preprotein translocase subunit SecA, partial [Dermatophilaceae bacterium]|nr:preprotein translocase subunit SecA [Dermatophilaceae bacterium]